MQPKQMIQTKEGESPSGPIFVEAEKLFEQVKELSRSVARRAYQFFEVRGGANGNDLDDWFRAESELLRPVAVEIKEA
jgi:HSP20 family protein